MNSKETTILSIALGTWMTWRLVGSSLIPVGSQEIGIAIIVLFKPWLDYRGWLSLLSINAMSWIPAWYWAWNGISSLIDEAYLESMRLAGSVPENMNSFSISLGASLFIAINFLYYYFVWPHIWERVYRKVGVWRKLKGG